MARVFVARDTVLGRRVVVKTLGDAPLAGPEADRFRREILLAAGLQHPNIVPLLSAGTTSEGVPYYVMPFVEGDTLRARLTRGAVPPAEVAALLRDVARALGAAHRRGIVHRDIKPENIFLSEGVAVVSDFGVAKALDAASPLRATGTGMAIGTPAYMAPEQASADPKSGARADLYSLGLVGWELVAGRHPFEGMNAAAMLVAQVGLPVPTIESVVPSVPPELAALLGELLEKDPARRPVDADAVVTSLTTLVTPGGSPPVTMRTPQAVDAPRIDASRMLRRVLVGGALTVAIAAIAWWVQRQRGTPTGDAGGGATPAASAWAVPVTEVRVAEADTALRELLGEASSGVRGPAVVEETPGLPRVASAIVARRRGRNVSFESLDGIAFSSLSLDLPRAELTSRAAGALLAMFAEELGTWTLPAGSAPRVEAVQLYRSFDRLARSRPGSVGPEISEMAAMLDRLATEFPDWPMGAMLGALQVNPGLWPGRGRFVASVQVKRAQLTATEQAALASLESFASGDRNRQIVALRALVRETRSPVFGRALALWLSYLRQYDEAIGMLLALGPGPGEEHLSYWAALTSSLHLVARHDEELMASDKAILESGSRVGVRLYRVRALAALGRSDDLLAALRELPGLPTDAFISAGWAMAIAGNELARHGRPEAAALAYKQSDDWYRVLLPREVTARSSAEHAHVLVALGLGDEAMRSTADAVRASDSRAYFAFRAVIAARLGRREDASRWANEWRAHAVDSLNTSSAIALNYLTETGVLPGSEGVVESRLAIHAGERERALSELLRSIASDRTPISLLVLHVDPDFATLQDDPRIRALMRAP